MARADLEQFMLAEIAKSGGCPKRLRISIELRGEGRWAVGPLDQTQDRVFRRGALGALKARPRPGLECRGTHDASGKNSIAE